MKERALRLSVIVPVYNTERYLSACLDSLLAQTLPPEDWEILVVDDGSTDGAGALADRYESEHPSLVHVIHQENRGSSAARNAGIKASRGRFLGFVDSDDTVEPGMYAALLEAVEKTSLPMAQTGRDERGAEGEALPMVVRIPEEIYRMRAEEMLFSLLLHEGDASFCTRITARELFADLSFPEGELNEDFKLLIQMLERMEALVLLPRVDYHVRYRLGSNSRKERNQADYFPPVYTDIVRNADFAMELVSSRHPGLLPAARRFALVQRLDYLLHIPVGRMTRDNDFYRQVVLYIRQNRREILLNPYLDKRQRRNLWLMSFAPRTLRALHKRVKKL